MRPRWRVRLVGPGHWGGLGAVRLRALREGAGAFATRLADSAEQGHAAQLAQCAACGFAVTERFADCDPPELGMAARL